MYSSSFCCVSVNILNDITNAASIADRSYLRLNELDFTGLPSDVSINGQF